MIDPLILRHRLLRPLLPWVLPLRRVLTQSGYDRLHLAYQRDFLRRQKAYPGGVPYQLLSTALVAPGVRAYRLRAQVGVRHHGGNTLLVRWHNQDAELRALLRVTGWSGAQLVRLRTASSPLSPGAWITTTLTTMLRDHLEIRQPSAALLNHLNLATPPVKPGWHLSAVIAQADTSWLTPEQLATWQPRLQPRSYSISAIERLADRGEIVEILVSQVEETYAQGNGGLSTVLGRCCGYLASLEPGRDRLYAWPLAFPLTLATHRYARTSRTQPPSQPPLLVIATGIAAAGPMLELQELESQRPLWMIVGIRHFDPQQPFLQRLLHFANARPAMRLDLALSRDPEPAWDALTNIAWHGHQRVQDVLSKQHARFQAHFNAAGDTVVIGHTSMGASVQHWLQDFFQSHTLATTPQEAASLLRRLEGQLRVQYSLSGR
jgi:sulfite reductase alpha subunit-like flavoprotein